MDRRRRLYFYKDYFEKFFDKQNKKVQKKILWTLKLLEEMDWIPESYLKHIENTSGLYEIRVRVSGNIYRIFCFFDMDDIIVIGHGFQKKSRKLPKREIKRAEQIKKEYYESKK